MLKVLDYSVFHNSLGGFILTSALLAYAYFSSGNLFVDKFSKYFMTLCARHYSRSRQKSLPSWSLHSCWNNTGIEVRRCGIE